MKRVFYNISKFNWFIDHKADNTVEADGEQTKEPLTRQEKDYLIAEAEATGLTDYITRETDKAVKIEYTIEHTKVCPRSAIPADFAAAVDNVKPGETVTYKGKDLTLKEADKLTVTLARYKHLTVWVPRTCLPAPEVYEIPDTLTEGKIVRARMLGGAKPGRWSYYIVIEARQKEARAVVCDAAGVVSPGSAEVYIPYAAAGKYIDPEAKL